LADKIYPNAGVKQGCPLSPLLFGLFIERIGIYLQNGGGIQVEHLIVFMLLYADDMAIMGKSSEVVTLLLSQLKQFCEDHNMEVNVEKTKVVRFLARYQINSIEHKR